METPTSLSIGVAPISCLRPLSTSYVVPTPIYSSSTPPSPSRATRIRAMQGLDPSHFHQDSNIDHVERPAHLPALPQFSFNPGANIASDSNENLLPLRYPPFSRSIAITGRTAGFGHRRGGSEFIGGSLSLAATSSSPATSDHGLPLPNIAILPVRQMHMRNRSAIPTLTSSTILQPTDANAMLFPNGHSAPVTPANFGQDKGENTYSPSHCLDPDLGGERNDSEHPAFNRRSSSPRAPTRSRVGFSDTLEFIPRPLSLVSTDTSSTVTVTPGHAYSGSISSLVSVSQPASAKTQVSPILPRSPTLDISESRPSTAGAILEWSLRPDLSDSVEILPRRRNSIQSLVDVNSASTASSSERSPTKISKRWTFFGLDPFVGASSPTKLRPTSSGSNVSSPGFDISATLSSEDKPAAKSKSDTFRSVQLRVAGKVARKKKVKTWAGQILYRRPKVSRYCGRNVGTQTDPPFVFLCQERGHRLPATVSAVDAFHDNHVYLDDHDDHDDTKEVAEVTGPVKSVDDSTMRLTAAKEEDQSYQMIDLDAALGPFNTPLPQNPEWEAAQKAAALHSKRHLHSAQGLKGFGGPGMHYHRRSESAPEMVPFESRILHRYGSSSTMADVFEEDEEDDEQDSISAKSLIKPSQDAEGSEAEASPVTIEYSTDATEAPAGDKQHLRKPQELAVVSLPDSRTEGESATPSSLRWDLQILVNARDSMSGLEENGAMETVPTTMLPPPMLPPSILRSSEIFAQTSEEDLSSMPHQVSGRHRRSKMLLPVDVAPLHIPTSAQSPYATSHTSSFPSPRSAASYDGQLYPTTPSSVDDESHLHSLRLGEPGPDFRRTSVDDVPSMTSAASSTTRDSSFRQKTSFFPPVTHSDHPPVSVSSAGIGRRRSSLASLGRLISSSHGERSKLSNELTCDGKADEHPRSRKTSRAKRLSRIVQFWKPKTEGDE